MTGSPMAGMFAAGRGIRSIGWCEEFLIMTETNLNVSESLQNIIGWGKAKGPVACRSYAHIDRRKRCSPPTLVL